MTEIDVVKMIAEIIGACSVVGAAVFGVMKFVAGHVNGEIDKYDELARKREELRDGTLNSLMESLKNHFENQNGQEKLIFGHLNEIDLWRKEINGQIKMFGIQLEFANKISESQKDQIIVLVASHQQTAISVARILEHLESKQKMGTV
jgi:hypothetical protein